jgi:radical SAM enzyme (TIGR01210 family)
MTTEDAIFELHRTYGPSKQMGAGAPSTERPHFFLVRTFLGEQDLAILFNTKRCRYQCRFCALPAKSSLERIAPNDILQQFLYVASEVKHCLGILDRLTIANEGSVLDCDTFGRNALHEIVGATRRLPRLRTIVIETRLEFVRSAELYELDVLSRKHLNILTGFETLDSRIRDEVLGKRETIAGFLGGLDEIARASASLTAYVLFKPSPEMSDASALQEARATIEFLRQEASSRGIPLTIRLNPMYSACDTPWARDAARLGSAYEPPRLSDVLALAKSVEQEGTRVYIGLTSEGLADPINTYRARSDFSSTVLKASIVSNMR